MSEMTLPHGTDQTRLDIGGDLCSECPPEARHDSWSVPRRRPDGSIDFDFYRTVAGQERHLAARRAFKIALARLLRLFRHLAAQLRLGTLPGEVSAHMAGDRRAQ
jgi:hypothetical protein